MEMRRAADIPAKTMTGMVNERGQVITGGVVDEVGSIQDEQGAVTDDERAESDYSGE